MVGKVRGRGTGGGASCGVAAPFGRRGVGEDLETEGVADEGFVETLGRTVDLKDVVSGPFLTLADVVVLFDENENSFGCSLFGVDEVEERFGQTTGR